MSDTQLRIISTIAKELSAVNPTKESQVQAAIELLDDGATVPFISRYRKEVTGALDDTQLRTLEERLKYLLKMQRCYLERVNIWKTMPWSLPKVATGKEQEGIKFKDYFDYQEPFKKVPSHRALAIFRGRNEGILYVTLDVEAPGEHGRAADAWLLQVVSWTWKIKMHMHISGDLMNQLREQAETEAIRVFSLNLKDLLLAAPAGQKATIGLDPWFAYWSKSSDVTIRGAVSIARRLQDPLAELVKIEPKSIGVGQYQHDVNQYQLTNSLEAVIEDCVNDVGVELNTASMPLLKQVSGLNETLANNIVDFRNANGSFHQSRNAKTSPTHGREIV
ncbi:hypothetical protein GQR58_021972 [Nymphon striatum]|nr:hypothetical protein GQR58_021972 [Nymphon striatum]